MENNNLLTANQISLEKQLQEVTQQKKILKDRNNKVDQNLQINQLYLQKTRENM